MSCHFGRLARAVMFCAFACFLGIGNGWAQATNSIGFPSTTNCGNSAPPLKPGTNPGFPGQWWNPDRYGTAWEFFFSSNPNQIVVYWLTYNAKRQPVWLTNSGNSTKQTASNGAIEFWSPLYQESLPPSSTPTKTETQVGEISIAFVPGSTTIAAVRWKWNAVGASSYDECVYDFFHGNTPSNAASINESYTGNWYDPANPGWGLDVNVGTVTSGGTTTTYEINNALIYDTAGQPTWLEGTVQNSTTASTNISVEYDKSKYTGGFPTTKCSRKLPRSVDTR